MKKQNERQQRFVKDKKFLTYTAFAVTAALMAILVIVMAAVVANRDSVSVGNVSDSSNSASGEVGNSGEEDETGGVLFEDFALPVSYVSVGTEYGFFHNQTIGAYYQHDGIDFMAEIGEEVCSAQAGTVESIFLTDVLTGTEIVVNHGNGVKSVYRFIEAVEGLEVGDEISRGQVIATVAEPTGAEYKDGAHLHFEVWKDGVPVDPTVYLTFAEK